MAKEGAHSMSFSTLSFRLKPRKSKALESPRTNILNKKVNNVTKKIKNKRVAFARKAVKASG